METRRFECSHSARLPVIGSMARPLDPERDNSTVDERLVPQCND